MKNYYSKKELKEKGWNQWLIKSYLGEPDKTLINYRDATIPYWRKVKVDAFEQDDEVKTKIQKWKQGREKRSYVASRILMIHKAVMSESVFSYIMRFDVPVIPLEELYATSFSFFKEKGGLCGEGVSDFPYDLGTLLDKEKWQDCPEDFLIVVSMNYLRNREETGYTNFVEDLFHGSKYSKKNSIRKYKWQAYKMLKEGVNKKIFEAYPMFNTPKIVKYENVY